MRVVEAVEPPNERDNAWGTGMPAQMRSYMQALYARYKSDPATRSITILGPSFANTKESARRLQAAFSDAAKYMDCGNVHSYCGRDPEGSGGGGYGISLSEALTRQRMGSTKAVWASENGYKMSRSRLATRPSRSALPPSTYLGRSSATCCVAPRAFMAIS